MIKLLHPNAKICRCEGPNRPLYEVGRRSNPAMLSEGEYWDITPESGNFDKVLQDTRSGRMYHLLPWEFNKMVGQTIKKTSKFKNTLNTLRVKYYWKRSVKAYQTLTEKYDYLFNKPRLMKPTYWKQMKFQKELYESWIRKEKKGE